MDAVAWVWFKRDLRVHDHAPLHAAWAAQQAARAAGQRLQVRALLLVEPAWLGSPEFDPQHLACLRDSAGALRTALAERGLGLRCHAGPAVAVFEALRQQAAGSGNLVSLYSHEETGPGWTYDRDRAVAAWCRAHGVAWHESAQTGVVRRLRSRTGWAGRWQQRMGSPLVPAPGRFDDGDSGDAADVAQALVEAAPQHAAAVQRDPAWSRPGEAAAQADLHDFLHRRGGDYRRALSSPLTAEAGCSRLSAHLAFGTLSMRQVHQATEARIAAVAAATSADDPAERRFAHALRGFAGRLRWHCHFMQKLEDEPRIEFGNFARVCDGLRPGDGEAAPWTDEAQARFDAWCAGATGFPMVDACMRSLRATGWLNFRMRAMLVSVASAHLWLHWRPTGLFLARQFLDFEPGIHWSQMQMQSGTTGINTLRIYSPTKQALDHDPDGVFIRRWVPELARVPPARLATPWRLSTAEQLEAGCVIGQHYPAPIVDERAAAQAAKDRLYGLRRQPASRAEADAIQQRHGSRKSGLPRSGVGSARRAPRKAKGAGPGAPVQEDLFASLQNVVDIEE